MKTIKTSFTTKDSKGNTYVIDQEATVNVSQYLDDPDEVWSGIPKLTHKGHPVSHVSGNTFYIAHLNTQVDKVL